MPEQNLNSELPAETPGEKGNGAERFESDTQKIVRKHLEDKDHVITDEEIASLRVGMVPPLDEATESRFEGDEAIENVEDEVVGDEKKIDEGENGRDNRLTTWDTIEPS